MDQLRALWKLAGGANALDEDTRKAWHARGMELKAAARAGQGNSAEAGVQDPVSGTSTVDGQQEPDRDAAWTRVLALAAERGWDTEQAVARMKDVIGKDQFDADGWDFSIFAEQIEAGRVAS